MAVQYAFGKIITQGLDLNVDAADPTSYPGTGTSWTSVVNRSITGSIVSCSFSSDFKGGIVFDNPTASVEFPGTVANYGTGSFTVEMAFRPSQIEGIHYLVSKNSGSYPNWGVYLSGSGGSGKLFAEYNIDASVSCSVSSSTTFETGSNYFVDVVFGPIEKRTYINVDGEYDAISITSNGTGSLTTTESLFLGNLAVSSSQAYSGSIFNTKVYSTFTSGYSNYRTITQRIQKTPPVRPTNALALIVGGGGGGGVAQGGGGGAGGFVLTSLALTPQSYTVFVGDGGARSTGFGDPGSNGEASYINTSVAEGGGGGGSTFNRNGVNGGSGGGASRGSSTPGTGSAGQGNSGATGTEGGSAGFSGGGGGGAGTSGNVPTILSAGTGGAGLPSSITGTTVYYAGGGGGGLTQGSQVGGAGGIGGGGSGSVDSEQAQPGTPNTGGGGGGGGSNNAADGGSGIVIIRYPGVPIATGGTITQVDGETVHTFTETGSNTFTVF